MDNFLYHYRGSYIMEEAVAEPTYSPSQHRAQLLAADGGARHHRNRVVTGSPGCGWLTCGARLRNQWIVLLAGIAGAMVDFLATEWLTTPISGRHGIPFLAAGGYASSYRKMFAATPFSIGANRVNYAGSLVY